MTTALIVLLVAAVSSGAIFVLMRWGEAAGEVAAGAAEEELKDKAGR